MKKEYIQPSMKAYKVKPEQVICSSGGDSESVFTSTDPDDVPTVTITDWGIGIWSE